MILQEIGQRAKDCKTTLAKLDTNKKNEVLQAIGESLIQETDYIILENAKDMEAGAQKGMQQGLLDRLMLDKNRIHQMAKGVIQVASLEDPIGEVLSMKKRPNGLVIGQKRVPMGVIGIIYESRPNVTADAFSLCFKTGNAVILKGGSDALFSNKAIVSVIQTVLEKHQVPKEAIQLIEATDRETATEFMRMNGYIDVLIPRGGAGLISAVVKNATVPVIETGTGNCHIYVDESADFDMAADIIFNAKTQRISVCNACESLVIHQKIVDAFMPYVAKRLKEKAVEIRGDEKSYEAVKSSGVYDDMRGYLKPAEEADYKTEYLDYILSVKTVSSIEEAIEHINRNNTGHSEAIITNDYSHAQQFLEEIDAAAVYVNASTRFTDGFEFGFGAEIGISTQKLHARGPMGLLALTSTKYIIYGSGQIRR